MNSTDYLNLYSGDGCKIEVKDAVITVNHPQIRDIKDHGEQDYYNMIFTMCAVGADMKWQLDDMGVDYTMVDDFDLFSQWLCRVYPQDKTSILLGDLDFSKFALVRDTKLDENVLVNVDTGMRIDRYAYRQIIDTIREMHGLKRNDELPGNKATKQILIEDAREAYEEAKGKEYKSILLPLVSTLTVNSGCDYEKVLNMPIYTFMDAVKRISKIKNADLLLQSGYSGFGVDLKKINKDELNYMGELK